MLKSVSDRLLQSYFHTPFLSLLPRVCIHTYNTLSHTSHTHSPTGHLPHTQNGYWAVFTPSISGSNLEFYPCPPGYCACTQYSDVGNTTCVYTYTNTDPDRQCTCDRKGILILYFVVIWQLWVYMKLSTWVEQIACEEQFIKEYCQRLTVMSQTDSLMCCLSY